MREYGIIQGKQNTREEVRATVRPCLFQHLDVSWKKRSGKVRLQMITIGQKHRVEKVE